MLSLISVSKLWGAHRALDAITLTIPNGTFFTLVGNSGSGKSSLLRLIAGLDTPTQGDIQKNGKSLLRLPPHKREIAMVFQNYALFPHLSVFENIAFSLREQRKHDEDIRQTVAHYADMLGLSDKQTHSVLTLSGGEQQRVAIARALATGFETILFDEPLSNLDAPLRLALQRDLKAIQRQTEKTFIYVTHDQEEALSLSDGVAFLKAGRLLDFGTPEELYSNPKTIESAVFFGQSVRFDATRISPSEIKTPRGLVLPVSESLQGEAFTVVIRPEHISEQPDNEDGSKKANKPKPQGIGASRRFQAEVKARFFKGDYTEYIVRIGDEMMMMRERDGFMGGEVKISGFFIFPK